MVTNKRKIGDLGEDLACKFLVKQGFEILGRNYLKKWGEIDIVVSKGGFLHFIEVKTVSHVTNHQPEENIHPWKCKRMARTIRTYLLEKKVSDETEWIVDMIAVFLNFETRKASFRMTENIILQ